MFDFHMHSRVSYDTDSDPLAMVLAAKNAGLREICFTDHSDYCPGVAHSTISFSREQYRTAYENLSVPGITIRHGMELGLSSEFTEEMDAEIAAFPYDFILGSIHCVDGIDTYFPELWRGRDPRQIERRYFEAMLDCVSRCNCFDVLSHMTFISKSPCNPAPRIIPPEDYGELIDEILRILVRKGKGMEINTSGVDKIGDFFPGLPYLRRFRELGGEIVTVGSDAHAPDRVGQYIPAALDAAREVFGYVCTFEQRKPVFHKL